MAHQTGGDTVTTHRQIGIIGAGPMAIFLVKHLIAHPAPLRITVFERAALAGPGMPYSDDMSPDYLLANIFSREIPVIQQSLASWLRDQPPASLARWDLSPDEISARAFYARTLLGAYLAAQMQGLVATGIAAGHAVTVLTGHDVTDIRPGDADVTVVARADGGQVALTFDQVVLATGHTWDDQPTEGSASLISPWPAANIAALPAAPIGIIGSSLSAVDVAVALAHQHGHFAPHGNGLVWTPLAGHEALHITMVSKTGILPEADFYYPYPYDALTHLTETAVTALSEDGRGDMLNRTFRLLMAEIAGCDPAYVTDLAMTEPTIEAFGQAYFARRQRRGAFRALQENLALSRATILRQETIAWRYALLRGHEVFETALPHLTEDERERFQTHLLPVFADCYAAVPHLSLDRLAALRKADAIDIIETTDDTIFEAIPMGGTNGPGGGGGVIVKIGDDSHSFSAMVDARGQTPALPAELPFPTLVGALADASMPVEAPFQMALRSGVGDQVFCLSMPQVLMRYPFSQGLPNCDALAKTVAEAMLGTA